MKPFSLLVKPASADCNLRCDYCFYLDRDSLYPETRVHRMSDEVLERMIRTFMAVPQPEYSIGWQGGEPSLMGLDFFKQVVQYQQKYGRAGASVGNGLQTNGTLIDDDFARFLAQYNFLVGLSIDGPAEVHDRFRVYADGRGSHARIMETVERLKRHQTQYNVLTLVSQSNIDRPRETYRYLCDLGVDFHQYIECVEFDETGQLQPYAIDGKQWGDFLCAVFDEWYPNDTRRVSVRLFDSILSRLVEGRPTVCAMGTDCRQYLVVEYNGDIYPCDFFVRPELKLGNILADDWATLQQKPLYKWFGARKREWVHACDECPYLAFCAGDCPKNRPGHGDQGAKLSVLCEGIKQFYAHTLPRFEKLADQVRREQQAQMQQQAAQRAAAQQAPFPGPPAGKVGRNDPCPCGSGKKFKRCCGANRSRSG